MIRKIFFSTVCVLLISMVASCSNSEEIANSESNTLLKSSTNSNELKLKWLAHWYGEGKKEVMIRELAREFSLLNQDIDLQLDFPHTAFKYSDESELFEISNDLIYKMVLNDEWPWDVMLCDQERYRKVGQLLNDPEWGQKYLVDFSGEDWFYDVHKPAIFQSGEFKKIYGGVLPGPLFEGVTNVLYLSEEVEALVGIKVKRHDMQFSEFLSYAQAVYNYNMIHEEKITFFSQQLNIAVSSMVTQLIQSAYQKESFSSLKESLDALFEVYEALEKLAGYKAIEQYTTFPGMAYDAAQRVLRQDKFLFNVQPSWMYLLWNNINPQGLKVMKPCELPSIDNKRSPSYSGFFQVVFVVPKHAQNVEAAKRLIRFISSGETAEKWIKYSKCPTGLQTKISYSDFGQEEFELFFRHLQNKYGNNQKGVNLPQLLFNRNITIDFLAEDVLNGKLTALQAIENVKKQLR